MKKIVFPSGVDLEVALEYSRLISDLHPGTQVLFDFSRIKWIGPFGMVLLSTCIEDAVKRLGPGHCFAVGHKSQSYMAHMGFFRVFGLNHGNKPGQASSSSTYRPITDFDCTPYYQAAVQGGVALGELMEEEAKRISSVLVQNVEGDLYETLSFAIREMLRNALEHSQTKVIRVCAQYWKSKDQVEVAILDHGRGIKASLSQNPYVKCESDRQALRPRSDARCVRDCF